MENPISLEHRLTEVEQRSRSNTKRMDRFEQVIEEIHTMSMTMVRLVEELKHTNEAVRMIDGKVDRMDSRVGEMERAPARRASAIREKVVGAVYGAVITFLVAGLLWAAVQAF